MLWGNTSSSHRSRKVFDSILGLLCKATKAGFQALLPQSNFKTGAMLKKGMTEHTELAGVGMPSYGTCRVGKECSCKSIISLLHPVQRDMLGQVQSFEEASKSTKLTRKQATPRALLP